MIFLKPILLTFTVLVVSIWFMPVTSVSYDEQRAVCCTLITTFSRYKDGNENDYNHISYDNTLEDYNREIHDKVKDPNNQGCIDDFIKTLRLDPKKYNNSRIITNIVIVLREKCTEIIKGFLADKVMLIKPITTCCYKIVPNSNENHLVKFIDDQLKNFPAEE